MKAQIRIIYAYYLTVSVFIGGILMLNIYGTPLVKEMDFVGWIFFFTSCLSHAAIIILPVLLIVLLATLWKPLRKTGIILFVSSVTVLAMLATLDMQVFHLYRFHINGIVLSLVFGGGGKEIFNFSTILYIKEILLLVFVGILPIILFFVIQKNINRITRKVVNIASICLILCCFFANAIHIYGHFTQNTSIMKARQVVPYYFPLSANRLLMKMGIEPPSVRSIPSDKESADVSYPLSPFNYKSESTEALPNIVLILIDSWSKRSLTPECMPNLYAYAKSNRWYDNHVSCSNGTRFAVFGLFFSVPAYYWESFEANRLSPLLIDELLRRGYDIRIHSSSTLVDPPFARVVFHRVPHLQANSTHGESALQRDTWITNEFTKELSGVKKRNRPFFSFLFYDLPHSFELPKDSLYKFQPSWPYADYTELSNDTDPTPFFNLYRNCCYQTDKLIGKVLRALEGENIENETIVIVTGDHAQEFNENHQNYWGHSSNFSKWQIAVPLIIHWPGKESGRYHHRTTHYDIVPTLMHDVFSVTNPVSDYSQGQLVDDCSPRNYHIVGHELKYAFILSGDTIATKHGDGMFEVTDCNLNPVENYKLTSQCFNEMVNRLNHFYK